MAGNEVDDDERVHIAIMCTLLGILSAIVVLALWFEHY
jgi:hypothetical protein